MITILDTKPGQKIAIICEHIDLNNEDTARVLIKSIRELYRKPLEEKQEEEIVINNPADLTKVLNQADGK